MLRKFIISSLVIILLASVSIPIVFIYSKSTQKIVINLFDLKSFLNRKIEKFLSDKINDKNLEINIQEIKFLEPKWPNIFRITFDDISIKSLKQKEHSNIKLLEIGFSYKDFLKNFYKNDNNIFFSYLNFNNLNLNAVVEKDKFSPGPLIKFLSGVNNDEIGNEQKIRKVFENQMAIGKVNILLLDKRNKFKERIFNIECRKILISKYINKERNLDMRCQDNNKIFFSVKANFLENSNKFSGNFENVKLELFLNEFSFFNSNIIKEKLFSNLNGNYEFVTDKQFNFKHFNFVSKESILALTFPEKKDEMIQTKFNGKIFWDKNKNLLNFKDITFGDKFLGNGHLNLISRTGLANLKIESFPLDLFKSYIKKHNHYFEQFTHYDLIDNYINTMEDGSLKGVNIVFNFSFLKKIKFTHIKGRSNFKNIRLQKANEFYKIIFNNFSGNANFEFFLQNNILINKSSWLDLDLDISNGELFSYKSSFDYKFDKAKITARFNQGSYVISKAKFTKNKKIEYVFSNLKLKNEILETGYLKLKNNLFFLSLLKDKFNIDLIGAADFNLLVKGNIKKLDFKLNLNSKLTSSRLNLHFLNIYKEKNTPASIKSEILIKQGRLKAFKDTVLQVKDYIYKVENVLFFDKSPNKIILRNIKAKNLILSQMVISKSNNKTNFLLTGKKVDLSSFKNNIQNKAIFSNKIYFDITADLIILNPKIFLSGNINGTLDKHVLEATALGKMWLGDSSLLDSGKIKIYIDDQISKLDGIGLNGGAETKIILKKLKNSYPEMTFDTTDGGKLLSALGFTSNIRSGKMKINLNFLNNSYNQYEGVIKSKKFSLINTPGFINSLSILSFSGIQSVISGEGVFFEKGQANIYVKDDIFNFDKVYLSSESLGIAARGKFNLKDSTINLIGSVAPIKLISQIISLVPAFGQLITGLKKEGLFAGQFKMIGLIDKPKIKLNTLSFAPGILRNFLSEDWLDNDGFFEKNNMN